MSNALLPPDGDYKAVAGGYYSTFQWSIYKYTVKFREGVRGVNVPDRITVVGNTFTSKVLGGEGYLETPAEQVAAQPKPQVASEFMLLSQLAVSFFIDLLDIKAWSVRDMHLQHRKVGLASEDPACKMLVELESCRTLDEQDIKIHGFLASHHMAKILQIEAFLSKKSR